MNQISRNNNNYDNNNHNIKLADLIKVNIIISKNNNFYCVFQCIQKLCVVQRIK